MKRISLVLACAALSLVQPGCASGPAINPRGAAQVSQASGPSRDAVWAACEEVARELHFTIDRRDFRAGVLTTDPMTSSQFFEPWRSELRSADDVVESSLATIRRTVRFEVSENAGRFVAKPSVRVERFALAERRMTSSVSYASAFKKTQTYGSPEADAGVILPRTYWYEIDPDEKLASYIAGRVSAKLSPGG